MAAFGSSHRQKEKRTIRVNETDWESSMYTDREERRLWGEEPS